MERKRQLLSVYGSEDQYLVLANLTLRQLELSMDKEHIYCAWGKQKVFVAVGKSLKKQTFFWDQVFLILYLELTLGEGYCI